MTSSVSSMTSLTQRRLSSVPDHTWSVELCAIDFIVSQDIGLFHYLLACLTLIESNKTVEFKLE